LIRGSRPIATVGKGAAAIGERAVGSQQVQALRVLEQGNRAGERTALVNHAHRTDEDSFLFVMTGTVQAEGQCSATRAPAYPQGVIDAGPWCSSNDRLMTAARTPAW
jgi:hypothetical protein